MGSFLSTMFGAMGSEASDGSNSLLMKTPGSLLIPEISDLNRVP